MKNKTLLSASLALMVAVPMQAQKIEDNFEDNFEENFEDKTLRLDYIVAGDSVNQAIYFEQAYSNPIWAGRKTGLQIMNWEMDGDAMTWDSRMRI